MCQILGGHGAPGLTLGVEAPGQLVDHLVSQQIEGGFMGEPEGGAVCRPQAVNRRFRVSRYLARKSAALWR